MNNYASKPARAGDLTSPVERRVAPGPEEAAGVSDPAAQFDFPHGNVLDAAAFKEQLGGDLELLTEMAGIFIEDSPRMLAAARDAIAQQNPQATMKAGHSLKGTLASLTAVTASGIARELEQAARNGNLAEAAKAFERLEKEMDRLIPVLIKLSQGATA